MKTAISIPDPLFKKADKLAKKRKLSRSELYRRALAEYVKRAEDEAITAAMNRVCDEVDTSLDDFGRTAAFRAHTRDLGPNGEW